MDFIFYPKYDRSLDGMILELKVDDTPEKAIDQIKEKKYDLRFRGKTGEKPSLLDCTRGRPPKGVLPPAVLAERKGAVPVPDSYAEGYSESDARKKLTICLGDMPNSFLNARK